MLDPDQRRLLGAFVRAHRERLSPENPAGRRRRTPGLRREELAARAGISATWCAWIEQGREVRASPETLGRLARALALTRAERAHLFELAGRRDPDAAAPEPADDAPPSVAALVVSLPHPAYGLDRFWNASCWNEPAARLFRGWLGEGLPRNLLRFVFLDAAARGLIPDWEARARRLLAEFRVDYGHALNDPRMRALVEGLRTESPLFAAAWSEQTVLDREGGVRLFAGPDGRPLRFRQHSFCPSDRPDHKLVVLLPA
ncbi:helix-turn-helix transcriptional regulator [Azospirillum oleiclasticum]|nr:helix-turn-helix transcriptional regulator [Azospirillum oleiclasticum]